VKRMTPNQPISKEKQEEIPKLCEKYNKGYVAKQLDISTKTVSKYLDKENIDW
jgi:hypothetical protein